MKSLYILFCAVSACIVQGSVVENPRINREWSAPVMRHSFVLPKQVHMRWDPVQSPNPAEPVLGYKLFVWEVPITVSYKYDTVNGVKTRFEEIKVDEEEEEFYPYPIKVSIKDPTQTKAYIGMENNNLYVFKLSAFTKTMDSASSEFAVRREGNKIYDTKIIDGLKDEPDNGNLHMDSSFMKNYY